MSNSTFHFQGDRKEERQEARKGSLRVVPDQWYQHHLGTFWKCRLSAPTPDLLTGELWGWDPGICVLVNPAGDSYVYPSWRCLVKQQIRVRNLRFILSVMSSLF